MSTSWRSRTRVLVGGALLVEVHPTAQPRRVRLAATHPKQRPVLGDELPHRTQDLHDAAAALASRASPAVLDPRHDPGRRGADDPHGTGQGGG